MKKCMNDIFEYPQDFLSSQVDICCRIVHNHVLCQLRCSARGRTSRVVIRYASNTDTVQSLLLAIISATAITRSRDLHWLRNMG